MHVRAIGFLLLATAIGISASAQSTRNPIEKAWKDPKRQENEAKADRKLHEKQSIVGDTTRATQKSRKKNPVKRKKSK